MAEKSPTEIKALMEAQGLKPDRHNWLYSFMNRTFTTKIANGVQGDVPWTDTIIYLVAYCKQCDQTISVVVPVGYNGGYNGTPRLSKADIPKLGCDWGGE